MEVVGKEFWDLRYKDKEYAYGTQPNSFFKNSIDQLETGKSILLPAEGEGRNAVYAAKKGHDVYAFDISEEARFKADRLAKREGVKFCYEVGKLSKLTLMNKKFDMAALIFAHFPPDILDEYHKTIAGLIKPGGLLIIEGFSKEHILKQKDDHRVGGPKNPEMLLSKNKIEEEFRSFETLKLEELDMELHEGMYHNGLASVIRYIGRKQISRINSNA